ncbi:MAG: tyrosine-protein phosphatase [Treponema sp.]|nr:tyrosine-protein phosphatase [Treponema sp.]
MNFNKIISVNIKDGILFRSGSPLKGGDEKKIKAELAVKAGINCVINLDDDSSVINALSKDVLWYKKLVDEGNVICLHMTYTIPGIKTNERKLKTALQFMINHKGPYLVHCFAGVDRTGFVSAFLQALMGASLGEICRGYLSAFNFDNSILSRIEKHGKMKNFLKQLTIMSHGENITKINLQTAAEQYLLNDIGLSSDEINKLKGALGI